MDSSIEPLLSLLQLTDSAMPIGGYSHSWGMETWVQNDVVTDRPSALEAIKVLLINSIATMDGIACSCAYQYCLEGAPENLPSLNQTLSASKWSKETYQASLRMGQRLLKLASETELVASFRGLESAGIDARTAEYPEYHHSIVFGWLAACADDSEANTLAAYLQNSSNCLISACVRLIPLGHTDGQKMVVALRPLIKRLVQSCSKRTIEDISSFAPLNEAACCAHESLYSRLFQS